MQQSERENEHFVRVIFLKGKIIMIELIVYD